MSLFIPKNDTFVSPTESLIWDTPQVELVYISLSGGGRVYELRVKPVMAETHELMSVMLRSVPSKNQRSRLSRRLLRAAREAQVGMDAEWEKEMATMSKEDFDVNL